MPGEAFASKAIAKNKSSPLPPSRRITNGSWNKTNIGIDGPEQAEASTSWQTWLVSASGAPLQSNEDATREQLRMPLLSSSGDERAGLVEEQTSPSAGEEGDAKKRKRGVRRARVMDLGRRMGGKLEEKGKHFIGKMRENARNNCLLLPDLEQATTPPAPS